jgi:hypothetical protein
MKTVRKIHVYWLLDTRRTPAVPFYAGATTNLQKRLLRHRWNAKRYPQWPLSGRILECGDCIDICPMETVPGGGAAASREQHWIEAGRASFDMLNVRPGGAGIRKDDPQLRAQALELVRAGVMTYAMMSRHVGVSRQMVRYWARMAGLAT